MSDTTPFRFKVPAGPTLRGAFFGDEAAPLVLLLHGAGQTRHAWRTAAQRLADTGYRALTFDSRGHGDSDWSSDGDYRLTTYSADLHALIPELGQPAILVGASLGGVSALLTAATAPEFVSALVLVDITPRFSSGGVARIRAFMQSHPDGFADLEAAAAAVNAYDPQRAHSANGDGLMKNLKRSEDGRLRWHWDPRLLHEAPTEATAQMLMDHSAAIPASIPTLLVRGANSDVVDDEGIEDFRRRVAHAEVAVAASVGHTAAGRHNDAFVNAIVPFLRRVRPPRSSPPAYTDAVL